QSCRSSRNAGRAARRMRNPTSTASRRAMGSGSGCRSVGARASGPVRAEQENVGEQRTGAAVGTQGDGSAIYLVRGACAPELLDAADDALQLLRVHAGVAVGHRAAVGGDRQPATGIDVA